MISGKLMIGINGDKNKNMLQKWRIMLLLQSLCVINNKDYL